MTPQRARCRIGSDVPVWPVCHTHTNAPTQAVYDTARKRDQYQLGLIVHNDRGTTLIGQVAPHDLISPILVAGNERDIVRVAKTVVAQRGGHEQLVCLLVDSAHRVDSQLRTISLQLVNSLIS